MIGLIDCNNFFVSCERVFRPDIWHTPVGVLSNNDGCIIARSQEVKDLGIAMGAPLHTFKDLVKQHRITLFSANFALYGDFSRRVMQIIQSEVPEIEVYSIDEAFVKFPVDRDPVEISQRIRDKIYTGIGIPVSIGIAPTKTLAKLASTQAKHSPRGIHILHTQDDWDPLLQETHLREIWGIGSKTTQKLWTYQIRTAYDLAYANDELVRSLSKVVGLRTAYELRGQSCMPLEEHPDSKKGITSSRTFGRSVYLLSELKQAVALYISRGAEKLRSEHLETTMIVVSIRTNPFSQETRQYRQNAYGGLATPTSDTRELIKRAHQLLDTIYEPGFAYKKAAISLLGLVPAGRAQGNLLISAEDQSIYNKNSKLQQAMDTLNKRYGQETVRIAATGIKRPWYAKASRKSPAYTTSWKDIPTIRLK